jgi:hypothetical protein
MEHCLGSEVTLNAHKRNIAQLGRFFLRRHHVVAVDTPVCIEEDDRRTMRTAQNLKDRLVGFHVCDFIGLGLVLVDGLIAKSDFAMRTLEIIDLEGIMLALLL